jgi:hypothetical protein
VTWPSTPRPARHNAPALSRTEAPPPTHARIARLLASPPPNTPCRCAPAAAARSRASRLSRPASTRRRVAWRINGISG